MASKTISTARSDERVAKVGAVRGIFRRPEVGASLGAAVIFVFFAAIRPDQFPTIHGIARFLDPASTLGIMAVAVALLMIGGEFDLSTGVMTGTTGLIAGLLSTQAGWNIWPAMLVALIFALGVGYLNGWLVVTTRLPSFIVTLATFFILRGANVGVTRLVTNQVRVSGIDGHLARMIFSTEFTLFGVAFRTSIIWWIVITLLASWILLRTIAPHQIRQLDLRRGRGPGSSPQCRGTGGSGQDCPVYDDRIGRLAGRHYERYAAALGGRQSGHRTGVCLHHLGGDRRLLGMARVGIVFAGWDTDWFYSFLGLMLLVAVIVNDYTRRKAEEVSAAAAKARTEGE